ncbi:MAG: zinc-dependent alcohol dehydrogenase [bacterium]
MPYEHYAQVVFTGRNRAELRQMAGPAGAAGGAAGAGEGDGAAGGRASAVATGRDTVGEQALGPRQILIRTDYTLISPGTELAWFSGMQREVSGDAFQYPIYSGYCHTGTVTACGPAVERFGVGDRVVTGAGHVSHVVVDTERDFEVTHSDLRKPLGRVPDNVPQVLAPFAKIAEIAVTAVRIADFSLGEKVLVLGQGMVGNLASQLFQLAGADVLAADISPFRLDKAKACGIRNVVNPAEENLQQVINDWSHGVGADVTVESAGNSRLLMEAVRYTRRLGDVIILGTPRKAHEFNPTPDLWHAHMKGITIKGALRCLFYPLHESNLNRRSVERDLCECLHLISSDQIRVKPLHTHTFTPAECGQAYADLLEARDTAIGAVFDWAATDDGAGGTP